MSSVQTADWHVHYFRDGCAEPEMSVPSILRTAQGRGITELGLLGRFVNRRVIRDIAYWMDPNPKFFDYLRYDLFCNSPALSDNPSAGEKTSIPRVLIGAEVDINTIEGDLSITSEQAARIDFVMAGIHWPPTLPPHIDYIDLKDPGRLVETYCSYNSVRAEDFSVKRLIADMFTSMIRAVERNPCINILAHPAGFATRLGPYCAEIDASGWFEKLAAALTVHAVAYELNSTTLRKYSPDVLAKFVKPLVRTCARAGATFAIGSDAHRLKEVGDLGSSLRLKEELQIPDERIVTSFERFSRKRT
ncbi:MAG: hypothetical protein HY801_00525 [Candidatus Lindowbacteria bacterium]|nr:hypothetical protein [Candidatus Lindowbacteria bacterium]